MSLPCRPFALAAGIALTASLTLSGSALAKTTPKKTVKRSTSKTTKKTTTATTSKGSVISTPSAVTASVTVPASLSATATVPEAPSTETTVAAFKDGRWKAQIGVYKSPDGPLLTKLTNGATIKGRVVFTVLEDEGDWLKVNVPARPNGAVGYVRAADVTTFTHTFSMIIELGNRRILVYQGGKLVHAETVAIGAPKTPTPTGKFFTVDLLRPVKGAGGPYGPYAYGISGFSNVYQRFGSGDGRLGIHGTNDPKRLGSAVTNGCIRLSNVGITKLRNVLPLGVPVEIRS